jgi:hypothetical protein
MILDVEEVGAPQVRVPVGLTGPEFGRVDLPREARLHAVRKVDVKLAAYVREEPADPGDHHVAGAELRLGVPGLEDPRGRGYAFTAPMCSRIFTS